MFEFCPLWGLRTANTRISCQAGDNASVTHFAKRKSAKCAPSPACHEIIAGPSTGEAPERAELKRKDYKMAKVKKQRKAVTRTGNIGAKVGGEIREDGSAYCWFTMAVHEDQSPEPTWYRCFAHGEASERVLGLIPNPTGGDPLEVDRLKSGDLITVSGLYSTAKNKKTRETEHHINIYRASGIMPVAPHKLSKKGAARLRALQRKAKA
jgi:hypothetical protein